MCEGGSNIWERVKIMKKELVGEKWTPGVAAQEEVVEMADWMRVCRAGMDGPEE